MNRNAFASAIFAILFFIVSDAYSAFYTIHLNNGNTIRTEKYFDMGKNIHFFLKSGSVGLPKKIIKHITTTDGSLNSSRLLYAPEAPQEEIPAEISYRSEDKQRAEVVDDITDRISVIDSNLDNLAKNKNSYIIQRENYIKNKIKTEERLEKLTNSPYITSEDLKERTELEQSKIMDIEQKIEENQAQINNTENMIENQKRMKKRLGSELARLNK